MTHSFKKGYKCVGGTVLVKYEDIFKPYFPWGKWVAGAALAATTVACLYTLAALGDSPYERQQVERAKQTQTTSTTLDTVLDRQ